MISCSQQMPSDGSEVLDNDLHREKSLRLSMGLEPSHLSLALACRLVGGLLFIGLVCQKQPQLDSIFSVSFTGRHNEILRSDYAVEVARAHEVFGRVSVNDENALNRLRGERLLEELYFPLDILGYSYADRRDRKLHFAQRDDVVCSVEQQVNLKPFPISGRRTEVWADGVVHARETKDSGNVSCVVNAKDLERLTAPRRETTSLRQACEHISMSCRFDLLQVGVY